MSKEFEFSVILPVCHGGGFLRGALASLRKLDFPPDRFEVLVAGADDDGESLKAVTDESASAAYAISYIPCGSPNRSARLNAACSKAKGRFLAFADDDCIFLPDWLEKLSEIFRRDPDIGIVGGRDEGDLNRRAFDLALDSVLNSFIGTGGLRRGSRISVGKYYPKLWNMAVPREVALYAATRGIEGPPQVFNESLIVHEDVDLAHRVEVLGRRIFFAHDMRISHYRDTTFRSFVGRNFRMARTCRSLEIHRFPHTVLAVFALGALSLSTASFFCQHLWIPLLVCAGLYSMALLAVSISRLRNTKKLTASLIIPPLLISLHFARGLGYLLPLKKGRDLR